MGRPYLSYRWEHTYYFACLLGLAVAIGAAFFVLLGHIFPDTYVIRDYSQTVDIVVESGDTYWSIAREYYPGQHTGKMVWLLEQINGVPPHQLQPGMTIKIPEGV